MKSICFCLFISLSSFLVGQNNDLSNLRTKKLFLSEGDTITIDTLSVIENSFSILLNDAEVSAETYVLLPYRSKVIWLAKSDTALLHYRVYPFLLTETISNKDTSLIGINPNFMLNPFTVQQKDLIDDPFGANELQKNGNISRGISFGNNQDVAVNSNMNIQLSGKISEDLTIRASINDQNVPFQVDGTTQKLQEFDQVFIEVEKGKNLLRAGDYMVRSNEFTFMRYNKKAQGLQIQLSDDKRNFTMLSGAAVSRGKFNRMALPIVEGNQGPYRLSGAENELFIVVLSGTERVFMDGELLERGRDLDYVIDYNTAEITFTANQMITKDKRVFVEFQYTAQNYARSLVFSEQTWKKDKWTFQSGVYSEQDAKNQSLQQQLDNDDKLLLSNIGDNLLAGVRPNVDSIAFNVNEVLYKKIDSLVLGETFNDVYVYSSHPDSATYRLGFSFVGTGNGNYIIDNLGTNGRVYKWVAPLNGEPQGDYEPVVLLITPKQKQMFVLGSNYQIDKQSNIYFESALSKEDLNTFSSINSDDDYGMAFNLGVKKIKRLANSKDSTLGWLTAMDAKYIHHTFKPIERFRDVEFERDWNLNIEQLNKNENMVTFKTGLTKGKYQNLIIGQTYYGVQDTVSGFKTFTDLNWRNRKGFKINQKGSYLTNLNTNNGFQFVRNQSNIVQKIGKINLQFKDLFEDNQRYLTSDSLGLGSFGIHDWQFALMSLDTAKINTKVYYGERLDRGLLNGKLKNSTYAHNTGMEVKLLKNRRFAFDIGANYRILENLDTLITNQKNENLLLNKLNLKTNLGKGFFVAQSFYEFGSGQELRKEYYYIQVPSGTGNFAWNDYNQNNVQELNEFEVAIYEDQANYIRVWRPTNDYIRTYSNQINQNLQINPGSLLKEEKTWQKVLSKFNHVFSYRAAQKTTVSNWQENINPFNEGVTSDELISLSSTTRNTLSFNRSSSVFAANYSAIENSSRILLSNGFEARSLNTRSAEIRYNFNKTMGMNINSSLIEKKRESEFFSENNYVIEGYDIEPSYFYQPSSYFRATINWKKQFKNNLLGLNEVFRNEQYGVEIRWSKVQKINLTSTFSFANVTYTSNPNTPLAFDMLEGLKPGENYLWSLIVSKNLNQSLQLNLQYNGRKTGDQQVIHNGGVQLRAIL